MKISILIPTLNAQNVLEGCLKSIQEQDYPKENLEIIIADGGSTDKTLSIAKKYKAKIFPNHLKTGEAGKAVALKYATGDLVALIDSDNILPNNNWLKTMVEPFHDKEIIGAEPWEYTYRESDGFIDRYCALMGMNDPMCYFLGNYDRMNVLSGRWTGLTIPQEDKGRWLKVTLKTPSIPTIGANGTIFRRSFFQDKTVLTVVKNYLFDIDVISIKANEQSVKFAKVKIGIIHLYCGTNIKKFFRKQKRRITDYLYYQKIGLRKYSWQKQNKLGLAKFVIFCGVIFFLLLQSARGYLKKPDTAWFFHPLACWITLITYSVGKISSYFKSDKLSREKWRQ